MSGRKPARDRFKIVGEEDRTPGERGGWRRLGIWVGPVCAVVVVRPTHKLEPEEDAKRALYRYLRRVSQTLLESGHILPLAGIIAADGERAAAPFHGWSADQGWHRGAFALYVTHDSNLSPRKEKPGAKAKEFDPHRLLDRLEDLLDPTVDAFLAAAPIGKSLDEYIADVEGLGRGDGASQELVEVCGRVVQTLRGAPGRADAGLVKEWAHKLIDDARKIARGEVT